MSLFGFFETTFSKGATDRAKGPLSPLYNNKFESNTFKYPLDLGSADKGHYMMIYVRQQDRSSYSDESFQNQNDYSGYSVGDELSNVVQGKSGVNFASPVMSKMGSAIGQINNATNGVLGKISDSFTKSFPNVSKGISDGVNDIFGPSGGSNVLSGSGVETQKIISNNVKTLTDNRFGLLKKTTRTTDAIALYMPDTLNFSYTQSYTDVRPGNSMLGQLVAAGGSDVEDLMTGRKKPNEIDLKRIITKSAAALGFLAANKALGDVGTLGAFAVTGNVINPMLEMLYVSPSFRTFQFDFMFYPRDEKEALEVQKIIERLRFHQAPELSDTLGKGFLIPPSEFEIKFYYSGSENPNIDPIGICVLKDIQVNYSPQGFHAYESGNSTKPILGGTGMPVLIQMTLTFTEVNYLTKDDFNDGKTKRTTPPVSIVYGTGNAGFGP